MRGDDWWVLLLPAAGIAIVIGLVIWAVRADNDWNARCASAGGTVRQYGTTYIMSGKCWFPFRSTNAFRVTERCCSGDPPVPVRIGDGLRHLSS